MMEKESVHISKLREGDLLAFEYIYNQWNAKVYYFVKNMVRNDIFLVEDIVQSVFVKLWEIKETVDPDGNLGGYLFKIAKNMVLNQLKRQIHHDRYQANEIASDISYLGNNVIEQELDVRFLESILEEYIFELPEKRRQVFILSRKYYMTNKQIAEHLGISVNTVESQMTKALATLRLKLDKINQLCFLPISNLILLELLKKM